MDSLIQDTLAAFRGALPQPSVSSTPAEPCVSLTRPLPTVWEIRWDGSFTGTAAGVGITIARPGGPALVSASVPVKGMDATRVEALGPPLAALLVTTRLPMGRVAFFGDSAYVVNLLAATTVPRDLYLFNCRELTRDLLADRSFTATWIPRD